MNDKLRVSYFCQDKASSSSSSSSTTTTTTTSHRQAVQCCVRTSDARTLFTCGRDTTIGVWRADSLAPLTTLVGHDDWINDALLVENDRVLVSASSDTALKLWHVAQFTKFNNNTDDNTKKKIDNTTNVASVTLHAHADYATALAASSETRRLFSVGLDARCYVWKLREAVQLLLPSNQDDDDDDDGDGAAPAEGEVVVKPCGVFSAPPVASLYAVATNSSGSAVAMGAADHIVRLWDPNSLERNCTQLIGHTDVVRCVAIDGAAQLCLSASTDCSVRLWDVRQRRCVRVFESHAASVWSLSVDPRFETFVSGDRDGQLFLTEVASGQSRAIVAAPDIAKRESILGTSIRWNYDSDSLRSLDIAMCTWQHSLWSKTAPPAASAVPPAQPISCRLWQVDAASAASSDVTVLAGRSGVRRCALLPDRRHALSADDDGTVRLWDLCRARELCSLDNTYPLEVVERCLSRPASLRAWASVKPVGGRLAVVVDALQALQCRTYANEAGFAPARHKRAQQFAPTARVNVGERVLAALFRVWVDKSPAAAAARLAFEQRRDELAAKQAAKAAAAAVKAAEAAAAVASGGGGLFSSKRRVSKMETETAATTTSASTAATNAAVPAANGHEDTFATASDAVYHVADSVQVVLSDRVTGATIRRATVQDLDCCGELAPWLTNLLVAEAALAQAPLPNVAFRLLAVDANVVYKLKGARMTASPLCKMTRLVKFVMQSATIELPRKAALGGAYRKFKSAQRRADQRERSFLRHIELGTIDKQFIEDCLGLLDDGGAKKPAHRRRRHRTHASAADQSSASSSESSQGADTNNNNNNNNNSSNNNQATAPQSQAPSSSSSRANGSDAPIEVPEHDNQSVENGNEDNNNELIDAADYLQILIGETVLPMSMDIATAKSLHWQEFERDVEFLFRVNPLWLK
jgi:WD40 repeat protein